MEKGQGEYAEEFDKRVKRTVYIDNLSDLATDVSLKISS